MICDRLGSKLFTNLDSYSPAQDASERSSWEADVIAIVLQGLFPDVCCHEHLRDELIMPKFGHVGAGQMVRLMAIINWNNSIPDMWPRHIPQSGLTEFMYPTQYSRHARRLSLDVCNVQYVGVMKPSPWRHDLENFLSDLPQFKMPGRFANIKPITITIDDDVGLTRDERCSTRVLTSARSFDLVNACDASLGKRGFGDLQC